ncbi:hypothetical protein HYW46_00920 [Candidatus Daviesbacteria bacterium]|nr:hypothetical protein [Candidatus Daviesbacteria bacterium]
MKILGINPNLLHDSGAALVLNDCLAAAVNEERFTRVKQQQGVPERSVFEVLKIANLTPAQIDRIHIAGYPPVKKLLALGKTFFRLLLFLKFDLVKISFSKDKFQSVISRRMAKGKGESMNMFVEAFKDIWDMERLLNRLRKEGFSGKICYIPHHLCHLYAAYSASGFWDKCLVVNIEGSSFEYTANAYIGDKGILKEVVSTPDPNSAGHFYAAFTELLGLRPGFDEGKVTGLSAWGRVGNLGEEFKNLYEVAVKMLKLENLKLKISPDVFLYPFFYSSTGRLPKLLEGFKKEEIAWVAQKRLEDVICPFVKQLLDQTGCKQIILTGGVAANVRLNQQVAELPGVNEIFVYPGMGDFGNAHGAAIAPKKNGRIKQTKLNDLYLGPEFSEEEMENLLFANKLKFKKITNGLEDIIAMELAQGKIICIFRGRMEYGPRALGNRSIIAATEIRLAGKLNKALNRDEFMPFAPLVVYHLGKKCFENINKAGYCAQFMTISFRAKDYFKKLCPAAVHIDNTSRPQLLQKKTNPFLYRVLTQYYKRTKIPGVINTSFNMHNEPIVCSPQDAIGTFLKSKLDILVMGNFLVRK